MPSERQRGRLGRRGLARTAAAVVLSLLSLAGAPVAHAQETAADYIEPRIERAQYESFIRELGLQREQRNIAELAYGDYLSALSDLAQQTDQAAQRAGRQTVQDAFNGKNRLAPDELKRLRVDVLRVYAQMFPAIDEAEAQFISNVHGTLLSEQEPAFAAALRELHRNILLHPRQVGSQYEDYAGDGVDVSDLVEGAQKDGGELAGLDPATFADILANYDLQLDAFLLATAGEYRQGKLDAKIAGVLKDAPAATRERQAAIDRWKRLYHLNQSTVEAIAAAAAPVIGEVNRQRWLERYDAACFAWMYPRKKPDRQFEWINKQASITAEQKQSAAQIYDQYLARRKELNKQAIDLMIRARLEFQTMLYSMMDPPGADDQVRKGLYDQLLKNSGEQTNVETTTSAALEGLLNDAQRKAMRDAVRGPDPAKRR